MNCPSGLFFVSAYQFLIFGLCVRKNDFSVTNCVILICYSGLRSQYDTDTKEDTMKPLMIHETEICSLADLREHFDLIQVTAAFLGRPRR